MPCAISGEHLQGGNGFGVTKNLDGLSAGVYDDAAVGAARQVLFEIQANGGIQRAVQVLAQFENYFLTVHCVSLRRKYLFNFWRSFKRARNRRDLTAASEIPRICAVSSVETPSTSRNRNATRKIGSSSPITEVRISFSSVCANFFSRRRAPVCDLAKDRILVGGQRLVQRNLVRPPPACEVSSALRSPQCAPARYKSRESPWKAIEVLIRLQEGVLHHVFGVFAVFGDIHAQTKDLVLSGSPIPQRRQGRRPWPQTPICSRRRGRPWMSAV